MSSTSGFSADVGQLNMVNGYSSKQYSAGDITSYGSYYNARVASALTANFVITAGTTYTTSICAKNWGAPSQAQFQAIVNNYQSSWNKVYAGGINFSEFSGQGSSGMWWSSTAVKDNVNGDHGFAILSINASTGNFSITGFNRTKYGRGVRCIAK